MAKYEMNENRYQAIFNRLNNFQRSVVLHENGPALTLSSAGSGKTATIIARIIHLIHKRGYDPKEILAITFTKKAAEEMKARLEEAVDDAGSDIPELTKIQTIHSFCMNLYNKTMMSMDPDFSKPAIMSSRMGMFYPDFIRLATKESIQLFNVQLDFYQSEVSFCKRSMITPEIYAQKHNLMENGKIKLDVMQKRGKTVYSPESSIFVFYKFYENWKLINNVMDFDDMLAFAYDCLVNERKRVYAERFLSRLSEIMVDECLPGKTNILLEDGTEKTIEEIVENKLKIRVLAYNTKTGNQEKCNVIGWSRTPNKKPLVKIKVAYPHPDFPNQKRRTLYQTVVCTTDHKVWADNKWIESGKIKVGMKMQSETLAKPNHKFKIGDAGKVVLSKEMIKKNSDETYREKIALNNTGGKLNKRGGNGTGLTSAQQILLGDLGPEWLPEFVVKTGLKPKQGYPHHYKIDLANPIKKIAVELDGHSHKNKKRREQDVKKEGLLKNQGWAVFRFKNAEVYNKSTEIINKLLCNDGKNCPVTSTVVSVEDYALNQPWVYDLTVEGCHNFYANGVLVHNCQDTSTLSFKILDQLMMSTKNVTIIGDSRQTIFQFAGADPKNITNFRKSYDPQVFDLKINYRSTKSIVANSNEFIAEAPHVIGDPAIAFNETNDHPIDIFVHPSDREEAQTLAEKIKYMIEAEGVDPRSIAVLYRVHSQAVSLEDALYTEKVPYFSYSKRAFYERREVLDIFAYLSLLNDPTRVSKNEFKRIANKPNNFISGQTIDKIFQIKKQERCSVLQAMHQLELDGWAYDGVLKLHARLSQGIEFASRATNVEQVVEFILKNMGYLQHMKEVLEVKDAEVDLEGNFDAIKSTASRFACISDFLDHIDELKSAGDKDENGPYVKLMTIHASKGREWDHVFVSGICSRIYPFHRCATQEEIEQERRIMYVAVTRPKKVLHLSCIEGKYGHFNVDPSPFIFSMKVDYREARKRDLEGGHRDRYYNDEI